MYNTPSSLSFPAVGRHVPPIPYHHLFVYLYSLGVFFTVLLVSCVDYFTPQSNLNIVKNEKHLRDINDNCLVRI